MHVQRGEGAGSREGQLAGGGEGWGDADGLGWHLVRKVYPQSDGQTSSRPLSQPWRGLHRARERSNTPAFQVRGKRVESRTGS